MRQYDNIADAWRLKRKTRQKRRRIAKEKRVLKRLWKRRDKMATRNEVKRLFL